MAKNHVQGAEKQTKFTATAAMTSGVPHIEGDSIGIPADTYAIGDFAVMWLDGQWRVACTSGDDIAVGVDLYWDSTPGEATLAAAAGANRYLGKAATVAGVGVTEVTVEVIQTEAP